jgi:hypothetical protein
VRADEDGEAVEGGHEGLREEGTRHLALGTRGRQKRNGK